MTRVFGYTRVSTAKQGEGVSLSEQKDSIKRYAEQHGLDVIEWFEEKETAAKRGRPVFTEVLKRLRKGEADGLVVHKIDRSARNLRDWADIGELLVLLCQILQPLPGPIPRLLESIGRLLRGLA